MIGILWTSKYNELKNLLTPLSHKVALYLILDELRMYSGKLKRAITHDLEIGSLMAQTTLGSEFISNYKSLTWNIFEKLIMELQH